MTISILLPGWLRRAHSFRRARTQVSAEKAATASELTGEQQKQRVPHTTDASESALALSENRSEPRATTNSGEIEGEGLLEGVRGAGAEESRSYTNDFAPDDDEDEGAGPAKEVEARVEKSGSYTDDFVDDNYEPYGDDSSEEGRGGTQQGVGNQEPHDASGAASGTAVATPGVRRSSNTTRSVEALTTTASVPESAVEGYSGADDRRGDESPQDVLRPRTSNAAAVAQEESPGGLQHPGGGGESTGVDSNVGRAAEAELEGGYEDEFFEESVEQRESAEVRVAEPTQPDITTDTEQSHPPLTNDASAEGDGVSTGLVLESQERTNLAREGTEPAEQTTPDADECRPLPGETTDNPTVLSVTLPNQSDGRGKADTELVAGVVGQEVENNSQGKPLAQRNESPAQVSSLEPMPTLIVVDALGNTRTASAHDISANEDDFGASTASKLAASKLASAAVASALDSALELMSGAPEVDFSKAGAHCVPGTAGAAAECIEEERASSAGVAPIAATVHSPSPTERSGSSERGAPLTGGASEECFEESFEDDTDENNAVRSEGDGTVASCSESSTFVGETDVSPSLSEQDSSEGLNPGGVGGEQAETGGEETHSGIEKAVHESSTVEYEDFEEDFEGDFEEEFEENVEEDVPSSRPKEELEDVDSGVADRGILRGSKKLDSQEPIATATAGAAGGEEPVEIPPPVEEVRFNRDCARVVDNPTASYESLHVVGTAIEDITKLLFWGLVPFRISWTT